MSTNVAPDFGLQGLSPALSTTLQLENEIMP